MKRPLMTAPLPFATPANARSKAVQSPPAAAPQPAPVEQEQPSVVPVRHKQHVTKAAPAKIVRPNQTRLAAKSKVRQPSTSREQRRQRTIEALEQRQVFAAPTLSPLTTQSLLSGAPLQIALQGDDTDGDPLTFSVTSDNPNIVADLRATTNRYLVLNISHTSSGQAGDSDFSGQMVFQLFEDLTPEVTARIITLVNQGFYDNLIFHRVINNFVIQGGDPLGDGTGGSGVKFDDEYNGDLQHTVSGLLSMAKSSDDTNDSQFFITEGSQRNLDFNHSIFGMLVSGESLRELISNVPTATGDKPASNVTITSATIETLTKYEVLTVKAANGYTGSGTITVTVDDGNGGTAQQTFTVNATPDTNENRPFLVNTPLQINASATGGAVNYQLQSTDVDGGPLAYYAYLENAADSSKVTVSINKTTGLLTVTPVNGFSGVVNIFVVASPLSDADHEFIAQQATTNNVSIKEAYDFYALYYDMQSIPVAVAPAAPTAIDLLPGSDTGNSDSDNITRNDNNGNASALTFRVSGVVSGATVELYDGATLIGFATAAGTTVDITTNGTAVLSGGVHGITARQILKNQTVDAGTQNRTTDLASGSSAALNITVDITPPVFTSAPVTSVVQFATYQYNANTDDEASTGALYDLTNAPTGMTIDPSTGLVTWLPTQAQINAGFADVTIQATDLAGNVSTQSYTITFVPNQAPTLDPVANQAVDETTTFTYALVAQDQNLPGDTLTYSLVSGPAGASVNPNTGVVTFTPGETLGGTSATFTVRVTDAGGLFSEQSFDLTINDTNANPFVAPIGPLSVPEGLELVVNINASDSDIPVDTLSYELINGPPGTTIDANGIIRWTPDETFGGTTQTISFKVLDSAGGSTISSFTVNVVEVNELPVLTVPTNHTINELLTLSFTASASDADAPAQTLLYSLSNAPAGMTINPNTGVVTWTPTEAQGPGIYNVQVIVTDSLGGTDSEIVSITVNETNQVPYLGPLDTLTAFPGGIFTAQIPGYDADLPIQGLVYTLEAAPAGLTINAATGAISWTLPDNAAEGIATITVRLTDSAGESVTRDYQIQISPFNIGKAFGLVSQWTSTAVPVQRTQSVDVSTLIRTAQAALADSFIAPENFVGNLTGNGATTQLGGLDRLQAVNGPEVVEALKPIVEGGATGAINESKSSEEKPATKPANPTDNNPFNSSTPSANPTAPVGNVPPGSGNQQSRRQRWLDWREHLRSAALVETAAADDVDLNWVSHAPQAPTMIVPEAVSALAPEVMAETKSEPQPTQVADNSTAEPLAASVGIAAVASLALRPRKSPPPVVIPVSTDEVRRKRGPRRNWY